MTCFVAHTTVDCRNAFELSEWWKQLLGYEDLADDPNAPGHDPEGNEFCILRSEAERVRTA